jgi:tRNA pseudouridine55 synthase
MRPIDGVLVIDKPAGPTSHDVVAVVRRALRAEKVGHTGTLDPLATGVLPLVIGRATRLASFLSGAEKEYVAQIRFGATTATYDAENVSAGRELEQQPPADRAAIAEVLPAFRGTFLQQPPPFSAKKIAGTPAYRLARQQKSVEIKPVETTVSTLELGSYADGVAEMRIICSSGFYVRSLAHDLGQRLGCGAFLQGLRRTRSGDFGLDVSRSLAEVVETGLAAGAWVVPMERLLTKMPALTLTEAGLSRASHGSSLKPADWVGAPPDISGEGTRLRLMDRSGGLVGIAESRAGGLLHPVIVLV